MEVQNWVSWQFSKWFSFDFWSKFSWSWPSFRSSHFNNFSNLGCFKNAISNWELNNTATGNLHPDEKPGRTICEDSNGTWEVCKEGKLSVSAAVLRHRVICFGYVVQEDPLPGKLNPDLLKQKGIPPGPLYAKIKSGHSIIASDGSSISPAEVVGPSRLGRKLVVLGDTCDSSQIVELAADADVLIHEATQENEMEEKAVERGHSTPGWLTSVNPTGTS